MLRSGIIRAARNRVAVLGALSALGLASLTFVQSPGAADRAGSTDLAGLVTTVAQESALASKAAATGATDYYLTIDGIPGESRDARRAGAIEISSFSWGASNSGSTHVGGGAGAGKVNLQDFSFAKALDKASPLLFQRVATGQHIPRVTLVAVSAGKQQQEYLKITLSDVLVSSFSSGGSAGAAPTENFSLNFSKIEIEYRPQNADGSLGSPVRAGYDVKAAKGI